MKILMAHNCFYVGGGADRLFFETAKLLVKNGHSVIFFSMKDEHNNGTQYSHYFVEKIEYDPIRPTFKSLRTALRMVYSFEARKKIEKLIEDTKPDIAHVHNIYGRLTPSVLDSMGKHSIPVLMTLHDYKLVCPAYVMMFGGRPCERCKGKRFYHAILRRCHKDSYLASSVYAAESCVHWLLRTYLRNVHFFVAPSWFMRRKMVEFGIPEGKIKYLPNFINYDGYDRSSADQDYLLYFGKLSKPKGVLTLLKAVKELSNLRLLIVGDGPLRKDLDEFVSKNGIHNVRFLGHLDDKGLSKVVEGARFCILPSEWYENAPMVVLEAFAHGKPVVGSRIGGIPELIDEGKDGFLFDPANVEDLKEKLQQMISKPADEVKRMGEMGRRKVRQHFSAESCYEKLISLYQSVLSD